MLAKLMPTRFEPSWHTFRANNAAHRPPSGKPELPRVSRGNAPLAALASSSPHQLPVRPRGTSHDSEAKQMVGAATIEFSAQLGPDRIVDRTRASAPPSASFQLRVRPFHPSPDSEAKTDGRCSNHRI